MPAMGTELTASQRGLSPYSTGTYPHTKPLPEETPRVPDWTLAGCTDTYGPDN
jgi:hypothetical protein